MFYSAALPDTYTLAPQPQAPKLAAGQPTYVQAINANGERVMIQVFQQQPRPQPQQALPVAGLSLPPHLQQQQFIHQPQLRPAPAAAPLQLRTSQPHQPALSTAAALAPQFQHANLRQMQPQQLPPQQPVYIMTASGALQQLPMQPQPQQQTLHHALANLQVQHANPQPNVLTSLPLGIQRPQHPTAAASPQQQQQALRLTSLPMASPGSGGGQQQILTSLSLGGQRLQGLHPHPPQQLQFVSPSVSMQLLNSAPLQGLHQPQQILQLANNPPPHHQRPVQLTSPGLSLAPCPAYQPLAAAPSSQLVQMLQQVHSTTQRTTNPPRRDSLKSLQETAKTRARVASHINGGVGGTAAPANPAPQQPCAANGSVSMPVSAASPNPVFTSGSLLVSSPAPPALHQLHPQPGGERVDQGLFLARLVEQQQQQQHSRAGFGLHRTSAGAPPSSGQQHPSAPQYQQQQEPEFRRREEEDSVGFGEHRRPAPRNTSAPVLQQQQLASASSPSPNHSSSPSSVQTPDPQEAIEQQQLKAASSGTNLQQLQALGGQANSYAPADNAAQGDPAAAAAAAATAALAQPICSTTSGSNGTMPQQQQAREGGGAEPMGGVGKNDLHSILSSIGVELARHGISVETAVGAGWLGVLSPADVKLLCEAYLGEGQRIQLLRSMPHGGEAGGSDNSVNSAAASQQDEQAAVGVSPLQPPLQQGAGGGADGEVAAVLKGKEASMNGAAGEGEGVQHASGEGSSAPTPTQLADSQENGQHKEWEQLQLNTGGAERAQLEEQLKQASPAQFSAFEYGFFSTPGAGADVQTELMECLEDLNQGIFDATGVVNSKKGQAVQEHQLLVKEGPLMQPPSSAGGGRDSDSDGPSDHELAARFANLDLGCGFF